jgi:acyl-homoserine-lactone acylase
MGRIEKTKRLREADARTLLRALSEAKGYMLEKFGSIEVAWGEVNRGRRGKRSWPLAGCEKNLRAIGTSGPDEDGVFYADRGQSCPTLVIFGPEIESYSAVPYGQSEDPNSPHFTDQGEELFARCRLKPTWFSEVGLLQNLESKVSMRISVE